MELLKLENQLCFPLYVCAKEIVKKYSPFLDKIGLTYTQYITMMVVWDKKKISVKELGESLFLDSGTLTPLLKRLEKQGLVKRERSTEDERVMIITLTEEGNQLKKEAEKIPEQIKECINITQEEAAVLYSSLYKLIENFKEK